VGERSRCGLALEGEADLLLQTLALLHQPTDVLGHVLNPITELGLVNRGDLVDQMLVFL
jgi:hypothetical protein